MALDSGYFEVINPAKDTNVLTNADRIRAMSDEELYDLFREIYNAGCDDATAWEWGTRQNTFIWDEEWLKQPADGSNVAE